MPACSTSTPRWPGRCPPGQVDEVFALIARHPLLTRQQLASLLRTTTGHIARLEGELAARGWVCSLTVDGDLPRGSNGPTRDQVQRLGLAELTPAGQQEAARRLLVPAGLARRRHGVFVSAASRRRFIRHLQHTLGANAFFVDLAAAALQVTSRGGDDALNEWRSAAACARGRFRPDGYGRYQRGPSRFGFFLEYDHGTERSSQYAAKLATYDRYCASSASIRDYRRFSSLLVVTTSELAETRVAHQAYLAQQRYGGTPLSIFMTTTSHIESCCDGILGTIWRSEPAPWANEPARAGWVLRLRHRGGTNSGTRIRVRRTALGSTISTAVAAAAGQEQPGAGELEYTETCDENDPSQPRLAHPGGRDEDHAR